MNSARSIRSASSEDTATRTNLEAAEEIARQLRLRDIGGLIVIDFIDMESSKHIRQVERAFADAMSRDKARYDVTRISKLGLMEVSRQRIRSTKASSSFMECPTCQGDGTVRTPEAAARAAFRKIQARVVKGDISGVKVFLPPEVALHLLNQKRDDLARLEGRYRVSIEVAPEERMKASQFEIEEVRREEPEVVPMVTADTVDKALVSGTLQPAPRPLETPEIAAPPKSQREAAEGTSRRRRRRRHRKTGGAVAAPYQDAAPRSEGVTATAPRAGAQVPPGPSDGPPGDQDEPPVYSEGPEDETRVPIAARAEALPGPVMPRFAELPAADGPQGASHRRRRRRRRHRGRGGPGTHPAASPQSEARSAFGTQRGGATQGGNGSADSTRQEATAPPRSEPALSPPAPRSSREIDAAPPPAGQAEREDVPADAQAEAKPKRRWWRRSFSRG